MQRGTPRQANVPAARPRLDLVRDQSGQSLILMTIAMFLFIAIGAFVIDQAQLSVAHHQAQVAADAAALSAAQDMSTTTTPTATVDNDGTTAATTNDPNATVTISQPTSLKAQATVTAPVNLPFGKMFGFGSGTVSAQAVAQVNTAVTNVDGTILSVGCGNSDTSNCTYCANALIPTGQTSADDGWEVTGTAEDETTAFTPATDSNYASDGSKCKTTTAGEPTVNLQTCQGSQGSGLCYDPGASDPEPSPYAEVVDLNGQTEGGMWQTVTTIPGARYVLNFWLTGNPGLNGWTGPNDTTNNFPLDVWVTDGANSEYTPTIASTDPASNVCDNATHRTSYITCKWWDYQDDQCGSNSDGLDLLSCVNGWEQADFTEESLTFVAKSTSTTLTFNSEVYDNDAYDSPQGKYWFFCGPEVANISLGFPAIQLVQ